MIRDAPDNATRAILFDFDGLVLDTEQTRLEAWTLGLARVGVVVDVEAYIRLTHTPPGCTSSQLAHELLAGEHRAEAVDALLRTINDDNLRLATRLQAMPGVQALLTACHAGRVPTGLVSGSARSWVGGHLHRLGLLDLFDVVITRDDVRSGKPDPALYLLALRHLAVAPQGAVAIEDSPIGLRSAYGAGIACVAVPNRVTAGLDFDQACAVYPSLRGVTLAELLEVAQPVQAR